MLESQLENAHIVSELTFEQRLAAVETGEGNLPSGGVVGQFVRKSTSGGFGADWSWEVPLRNVADTVTSFFSNTNTQSRTYTLPNKSGTVAFMDDVLLKVDKVAGKELSSNDFTTVLLTKVNGIAEGATANSTDAFLRSRSNHTGVQAITTVSGLYGELEARLHMNQLGVSVAPIEGGFVPAIYLPSYQDQVQEYYQLSALPQPGEAGVIYVVLENNKTYRWGGLDYVNIASSPGTTDEVFEGSSNKYFTENRVLSTVLTGLVVSAATALLETDNLLTAAGKLQAQLNGKQSTLTLITQAEVEAGTSTTVRSVTAQRLRQGVRATLANGSFDAGSVKEGDGLLIVDGVISSRTFSYDFGSERTVALDDVDFNEKRLIGGFRSGSSRWVETNTTASPVLDYAAAESWYLNCGAGAHTVSFINMLQANGGVKELLVAINNGGAGSWTFTGVSWVLPSGLTTTSLSEYMTAIGRTSFQTTELDFLLFWSFNLGAAGTKIYGKFI